MNAKAGIELSYMFLEEVIVVAVHVQHCPAPRWARLPTYQGCDYLALVIPSHSECRHLVVGPKDVGLPARDFVHDSLLVQAPRRTSRPGSESSALRAAARPTSRMRWTAFQSSRPIPSMAGVITRSARGRAAATLVTLARVMLRTMISVNRGMWCSLPVSTRLMGRAMRACSGRCARLTWRWGSVASTAITG